MTGPAPEPAQMWRGRVQDHLDAAGRTTDRSARGSTALTR